MYPINSMEYEKQFWNAMRGKNPAYNGLEQGRHPLTSSYIVPTANSKKLMESIRRENIFRTLATNVTATGSDFTVQVCDAKDIATWLGDDSLNTYYDGIDEFTRLPVKAHRLGTIVRIHEDFLADMTFDIESYLTTAFGKRIGHTEEDAFINGTSVDMPTGILAENGGADIGVTASALTYDDVIRLYFTLDKEYRKNGVWLMNDETALILRTLKDDSGNYLWNQNDNTILGKSVYISNYMPSAETGSKPIAFGDLSYYWVIQRFPFTVRAMKELYAANQQVGYLGYEHLDAKLIRPEAVKVMQMTNTTA